MILKHEGHVEPNSYATVRPFLSYNRHTWLSHALFDAAPIQAQTSRSNNPGPRSPTHMCSRRSQMLCWASGYTRRWSGIQDGESFGIPVGSYFSGLGQTYRYLQLDDGYLGVFGDRTLSWEWARSCWDGSARAGGWRCRYLVLVLSPKAAWCACPRHLSEMTT